MVIFFREHSNSPCISITSCLAFLKAFPNLCTGSYDAGFLLDRTGFTIVLRRPTKSPISTDGHRGTRSQFHKVRRCIHIPIVSAAVQWTIGTILLSDLGQIAAVHDTPDTSLESVNIFMRLVHPYIFFSVSRILLSLKYFSTRIFASCESFSQLPSSHVFFMRETMTPISPLSCTI